MLLTECVEKQRALQTEKMDLERQGAHKQTEREAKKDRESQRHAAGRWRSLRAPGQPSDEDSEEHN